MLPPFSAQQKAYVAQLFDAGAAYSAQRLEHLSKIPWKISSSSVQMLTVSEAAAAFQSDTTGHLGAHLRSQPPQSPIPLECLVLFPSRSVAPMAEAVTGKSSGMKAVPDRVNAIIGEVANILGQGIIKAIADKLGTSIILSVPQVLMGSKSDILSKVLYKVGGKRDAVILTDIELRSENLSTACSMILIFDADILRRFQPPAKQGW